MRAGTERSGITGWVDEALWLCGRVLRKLVFVALPIRFHFMIADLRYRFLPSSRPALENARKNIRAAFGEECDDAGVERIARAYDRFVQTAHVSKSIPRHARFDPKEYWPLEGVEYLRQALTEKKGVILATAHLGHARMIPSILDAHGYEARRVVADLPRLEARRRIEEWLARSSRFKARVYQGTEIYADPQGPDDLVAGLDIRPILSALAANQTLVVAGDGLRATTFVPLRLLGRQYPFPTGFMKIALMTGAVVLPAFAIPDHEGRRVRMEIGPPLDLDGKRSIENNLREYADALDAQLRRTPHLWLRWGRADWFEQALRWSNEAQKDPFSTVPSWLMEEGLS